MRVRPYRVDVDAHVLAVLFEHLSVNSKNHNALLSYYMYIYCTRTYI